MPRRRAWARARIGPRSPGAGRRRRSRCRTRARRGADALVPGPLGLHGFGPCDLGRQEADERPAARIPARDAVRSSTGLTARTLFSKETLMAIARTASDWRDFVQDCLDFRPEDNVYRIARAMFTEPELFDLEMELVFEKNWIYACHESEISKPHDYVTMQGRRQPLIITRDGTGSINALVNACAHRGATLTRVSRGHQSMFVCPFHAWTYKSDGKLVKVKAPAEYPQGFDL